MLHAWAVENSKQHLGTRVEKALTRHAGLKVGDGGSESVPF